MKRSLTTIFFFVLLLISSVQAQFRYSSQSYAQSIGQHSESVLAEADQMNAKVTTLYSEGKYDEALPLAKHVLEKRETVLGPAHPLVAAAALNLAELYIAKRKFKDAEPLLLRAIEINDKTLKPNDPAVVKTLGRYTCLMYRIDEKDKLEDFEEHRNKARRVTVESEQFWGALWKQTKAISMPRPEYPAAAKAGGATGVILIRVLLDERGEVIQAESMCGGNPSLVQPSIEAASKAKFTPIQLGGKAVKVIGYIPYVFVRR